MQVIRNDYGDGSSVNQSQQNFKKIKITEPYFKENIQIKIWQQKKLYSNDFRYGWLSIENGFLFKP